MRKSAWLVSAAALIVAAPAFANGAGVHIGGIPSKMMGGMHPIAGGMHTNVMGGMHTNLMGAPHTIMGGMHPVGGGMHPHGGMHPSAPHNMMIGMHSMGGMQHHMVMMGGPHHPMGGPHPGGNFHPHITKTIVNNMASSSSHSQAIAVNKNINKINNTNNVAAYSKAYGGNGYGGNASVVTGDTNVNVNVQSGGGFASSFGMMGMMALPFLLSAPAPQPVYSETYVEAPVVRHVRCGRGEVRYHGTCVLRRYGKAHSNTSVAKGKGHSTPASDPVPPANDSGRVINASRKSVSF